MSEGIKVFKAIVEREPEIYQGYVTGTIYREMCRFDLALKYLDIALNLSRIVGQCYRTNYFILSYQPKRSETEWIATLKKYGEAFGDKL